MNETNWTSKQWKQTNKKKQKHKQNTHNNQINNQTHTLLVFGDMMHGRVQSKRAFCNQES